MINYTKNVLAFNSIARTVTPTAWEMLNDNTNPHEAAQIVIVASAVTSTPSVVFNVEGYDEASNTWYLLIASAAIATASTVVLRIMIGGVATANLVVSDFPPARWRIRPVHANANSITYTVGVNLLGA